MRKTFELDLAVVAAVAVLLERIFFYERVG